MKQRGYYDLNVTGFIIGCLIVGAAIGIAIAYLVPWLVECANCINEAKAKGEPS